LCCYIESSGHTTAAAVAVVAGATIVLPLHTTTIGFGHPKP
jgi:hypothetical protein